MDKKENHDKFIIAEKSETVDTERAVVGWGSKPLPDRDGELIEASAWDLDNFRKNPVLCLSHDLSKPPVGKILWIKSDVNGLKFKAHFANTERGKELYQLYKEGVMNAFSVGFRPKQNGYIDNPIDPKYKGLRKVFTDVELFEISCVTIPSLPQAMVEYVKSGKIKNQDLKAEFEEVIKNVSSFTKDTTSIEIVMASIDDEDEKDIADENTEWDSAVETKDASIDDLKVMCAWYDSTKKAEELTKDSFKLPHHRQSDKKAVWKGIIAAMAAVKGSAMTTEDKKAVYDHLAQHYKEFEKEPPEFKTLEEGTVELKDILDKFTAFDAILKKVQEDIAKIGAKEKTESETKTLDFETGQPSVYDITNAISRALPKSFTESFDSNVVVPYACSSYVIDCYPTEYPNGVVIYYVVSNQNDVRGTLMYLRQNYTYDAITKTATLVDKPVQVQEAWVLKTYGEETIKNMTDAFEQKDTDDDDDEDVANLETKAGKVLSTAIITKLNDVIDTVAEAVDVLTEASDSLVELVEASTPKEDASKGVDVDEDDIDLDGMELETKVSIDGKIKTDSSSEDLQSDDIDLSSFDEKEVSALVSKAIGSALPGLNSILTETTKEEASKLLGKATI